jgi:2,3-bisphosphoglycerate-independent phosphoglycerate mutase
LRLQGNIKDLVDYVEKESSDYTFELIHRQTLDAASKAWDIKDYKNFIELIDRIDIYKVSKSFQLKYKIAKQKIW